MNSPKQTMYTCTVRILLDPRMCNATTGGACDWMSETLRNLEEHGLVDWGYVEQPEPVYVPVPYAEGDFLCGPPDNATCPTCGADGGTTCGDPNCGY